jgi:hypothetical protein
VAAKPNLVLKIDNFFIKSRVRVCLNMSCDFNKETKCNIKEIVIGDGGKCQFYEYYEYMNNKLRERIKKEGPDK